MIKAFIKNFSSRRSTYHGEVIFVTRILVFSDDGKVALGFNAWGVEKELQNISQVELETLTFDTFISLNPPPKLLMKERSKLTELKESIVKAYPEANLSDSDDFGFVLTGAPFIAWWDTEGSKLELKTQEIDMTKV